MSRVNGHFAVIRPFDTSHLDAYHLHRLLRHADGNTSTPIILSCILVATSRAGPVAFRLPPVEVQRTRQRPGALVSARRARALRRWMARRSSAESPPQTPSSWRESMAQLRQGSTTSQRPQTALASSIWTSAGPVFPLGKNRSGSTRRQAARSRQVIRIGLLASKVASITGVNSGGEPAGPIEFLKVNVSVNARSTASQCPDLKVSAAGSACGSMTRVRT